MTHTKERNAAVGKKASLLGLILLLVVVNFDFNTDQIGWKCVQFGALLALTLFWLWMAYYLSQPTTEEENQRKQNMEQAVQEAGDTGVTEEWWNQMGEILERTHIAKTMVTLILVLCLMLFCFPKSIAEAGGIWAQKTWEWALDTYSHKTLFIWGLWISEFIVFWSVGLIFAVLDFWRPAMLLPFKVQEDWKLTPERFKDAVLMALKNQFLELGFLYVLWHIYPFLSPAGFDRELPSLLSIVIQMVASLPMAEMWFYSGHCLMHASNWCWSHIHYHHHEWTSPIAITCIYAHWAEHLFINVVTVMLGPFIFGSHVVVWYIFGALGLLSTLHGHCGWRLPGGANCTGHDFHHSVGLGNFGTLGIMDALFNTDRWYLAAWQSKTDANFRNQDYPIVKILAYNGNDSSKEKKEENTEGTVTSGDGSNDRILVEKKKVNSNVNCHENEDCYVPVPPSFLKMKKGDDIMESVDLSDDNDSNDNENSEEECHGKKDEKNESQTFVYSNLNDSKQDLTIFPLFGIKHAINQPIVVKSSNHSYNSNKQGKKYD